MRRWNPVGRSVSILLVLAAIGASAEEKPLTVEEIQRYGRGLALWMEVRGKCGE
jgi:hypothetical protein